MIRYKKQLVYKLLFIVLILLAIIAYRFLFYYFTYSRDAYASADVIDISSSVSGQVSDVFVQDNQYVAAKQALLEVKSTIARAPANGYVTNVTVQKGDYIQAGDNLFALIQNDRWWVIARYRETVIRRIHIGDKVRITFDLYPDKVFHGIVQSIGWGINRKETSSEAAQSSLEYLKPTEDWIQIAQRFPVKIVLTDVDPNYPLRIGASAYTYIYADSYKNSLATIDKQ